MKISIDIPDEFAKLDKVSQQEQMIGILKQLGLLMKEHGQVVSAEYINALLIACGLFTGYCVTKVEDCQPVKLEVYCPRIMKEMLKTLGEYTAEGIMQKQRKLALQNAVPAGEG